MFRQLCSALFTLVWLCNIFHPIFGKYEVLLIQCIHKPINLAYNPPLAAANETNTENAAANGVWIGCQVEGIDVNITYQVTATFTQSNCEQATFTNFVMKGNIHITNDLLSGLFELTINVSDPNHVRYLDTPQIVYTYLKVPPGVYTPQPANVTFTFSREDHQRNTCKQISDEQIFMDAYLYLYNTNYNITDVLTGRK